MNLVGLIPAAGRAKRLVNLPCSKEIFPVGGEFIEENGVRQYQPKPAAMYLIERMLKTGVNRLIIVINRDKFDIPRFLGNGDSLGINISYLIQERVCGMPDALNIARAWLQDATVLFGMPDTIFQPIDAYQHLVKQHQQRKADLTLGLFETNQPEKFGMVSFDSEYRMTYTIDKPQKSNLEYMWGIACWSPVFTQYMADFLAKTEKTEEIVLGDVFQSAMESGLNVTVLPFKKGSYIDIGTSDDLGKVIKENAITL